MQTEIILLQSVKGLGVSGSIVKVAAGYFRNFLAPRQIAIRATQENIAALDLKKAELKEADLARRAEAEVLLQKFDNVNIDIARQSGDDGRLYGAVSAQDIASSIGALLGIKLDHHSIVLDKKIKELGQYTVSVVLHPDVIASVTLTVIRGDK